MQTVSKEKRETTSSLVQHIENIEHAINFKDTRTITESMISPNKTGQKSNGN